MGPPIDPPPPEADTSLPWDAAVADPTAELAAARAAHGDTFIVRSGERSYLFVFSPAGLRSFYALPESEASKGVADWQMLVRKLPDELFTGRRTTVHELFDRERVVTYLDRLDWAIDAQFTELGDHGEIDVFDLTRRLGHRLGLACWAGARFTDRAELDLLIGALDELDGAAAFVHPGDMADVAARGKDRERAAMETVEAVLAGVLARRAADPPDSSDLLDDIVERWADTSGEQRTIGIARDVILVHLGSMSNLFAALGWTIVDLLAHPDVLAAVRAGDPALTERCALESTRLHQRSIMLRAVLTPTEVSDEHHTYRLAPGTLVATYLPLLNLEALPGLDRYSPDHWVRRRLRDEHRLATREQVTTFGHGRHTCPAQPFSLAAMTRAVARLVETYDVEAVFSDPRPVTGQIGGVARSETPCPMRYRRRA